MSALLVRVLLPVRTRVWHGSRSPRLHRGTRGSSNGSLPHALTWISLHDNVRVSVGALGAFSAFHEIVPRGSSLPARFSKRFENAFAYSTYIKLDIAQQTGYSIPITAAELCLQGIRPSKEGEAQVGVTVSIERDLSGTATALDTSTKSIAETKFRLLEVEQPKIA